WPGAMFNNNGLTLGRVEEINAGEPIFFRPDIQDQYVNPNFSVPSGDINIFTQDFKYPQVFRANLGLDTKLPYGIRPLSRGSTRKPSTTSSTPISTVQRKDRKTGRTHRTTGSYIPGGRSIPPTHRF